MAANNDKKKDLSRDPIFCCQCNRRTHRLSKDKVEPNLLNNQIINGQIDYC